MAKKRRGEQPQHGVKRRRDQPVLDAKIMGDMSRFDSSSEEEPASEGLFDNLEDTEGNDLDETMFQAQDEQVNQDADLAEHPDDNMDAENTASEDDSDGAREPVSEDEAAENEADKDETGQAIFYDANHQHLHHPLSQPETAERFKRLYMALVTQAFGTSLDSIRQEENFDGRRLEVLIDSLESGSNYYSEHEKGLVVSTLD